MLFVCVFLISSLLFGILLENQRYNENGTEGEISAFPRCNYACTVTRVEIFLYAKFCLLSVASWIPLDDTPSQFLLK